MNRRQTLCGPAIPAADPPGRTGAAGGEAVQNQGS